MALNGGRAMKRAALYLRVSTVDQTTANQERELREVVTRKGYEIVKVYNAMHEKGFEILGISLDNADTLKNLGPVTKQQGMTWNQVADGKYWNAAVAKLYGVQAIPAAYIVDGDTGQIYAEGESIRGENFLPAVQKALATKSGGTK